MANQSDSDKSKEQEVKKVLADLERVGIRISTGTSEVSNKPTINSTH